MLKKNPNNGFLNLSHLSSWVFWGIFLFLVYCVWVVFKIYLLPFFFALVCYLLFQKPYSWLLILLKGHKTSAATIMSFSLVFILLIPSFHLFKALFGELNYALNNLQELLTKEAFIKFYDQNEWLKSIFSNLNLKIENIQDQLLKLTTNTGSIILDKGREFLSGIFTIFFNSLITILALFFLFKEGDRIASFVYSILPFPAKLEQKVGNELLQALDIMVKGTIIISITQGIFIGLFYWFFGLSTPILYGYLAAIFSLLPIIGTSIVWLPAVVYLYMKGDITSAVLMAILSYATYLILENIVKPFILDKKLPLHPLFLFLSILGGVAQWGINGFVLGPFVVTALVIFLELLKVWKEEYDTT